MSGTTISVSDENHWLLTRYKEGAGARSLDAALRLLLEGGPHSVWHLLDGRRADVRRIAKRFSVTRLVAFGSRVNGTAHGKSDLDLAFESNDRTNLDLLFGLGDALEDLLGVKIDLHTFSGLKPRIRSVVEREGVDCLA